MPARRMTIAVFNQSTGWNLSESAVERIRTQGDELGVVVSYARRQAELIDLLPETELLVGFPLTEDDVDRYAERLQWVQLVASVGLRLPALRVAVKRGARVCSAASIRAPQIAEHALAMTLALTRRIQSAALAQGEHGWRPRELTEELHDLNGSTVGVVATGTIAEAIVARLLPFGVRILLFCDDTESRGATELFPLEGLDESLSQCDILILAAMRADAPDGLISKRQLSRLRPSTLIVDVGRGGVLDQRALLDSLRRGPVAGAALDVFDVEPLAPTSPLWTMPNVLLPPHISAASPTYWNRATDVICRNLRAFIAGESLLDEITRAGILAN